MEVVAIVKSCFFFLFQNSKAKRQNLNLRKPDVVAVFFGACESKQDPYSCYTCKTSQPCLGRRNSEAPPVWDIGPLRHHVRTEVGQSRLQFAKDEIVGIAWQNDAECDC